MAFKSNEVAINWNAGLAYATARFHTCAGGSKGNKKRDKAGIDEGSQDGAALPGEEAPALGAPVGGDEGKEADVASMPVAQAPGMAAAPSSPAAPDAAEPKADTAASGKRHHGAREADGHKKTKRTRATRQKKTHHQRTGAAQRHHGHGHRRHDTTEADAAPSAASQALRYETPLPPISPP